MKLWQCRFFLRSSLLSMLGVRETGVDTETKHSCVIDRYEAEAQNASCAHAAPTSLWRVLGKLPGRDF